MDQAGYIHEFKNLARRMDIDIRYSEGGPSGLCILKGKQVFFLDRTLDEAAQLDLFIEHFRVLDLDGLYVIPALKRLLGKEDASSDW